MRLAPLVSCVAVASALAFGTVACGGSSDESSPSTAGTEQTIAETNQAHTAAVHALGATLVPAVGGQAGALVDSVESPHSLLRAGDRVVVVDRKPVRSPEDVGQAVPAFRIGAGFKVIVIRGSKRVTFVEVPSPTIYLGVNVQDAAKANPGVRIVGMDPGGPAASSRLRSGDVIISIDGTGVTHTADLLAEIATHQAGDIVRLTVRRESRVLIVPVSLEDRPG